MKIYALAAIAIAFLLAQPGMSRVQKVVLHPTEDRWQKTEDSKNNAL